MADAAYVAGLKLVARRELSEAQVRSRLERRQFADDEIDAAIARLKEERAIDDERTALACARTELHVHRHGRARALMRVERLGVARDLARSAVHAVFADVDEDSVMMEVLERRMRGRATLAAMDDADRRRLHRFLVARGFDPGRVASLLIRQSRSRSG